jgi:hypothetical protein
MCLWLPLTYPNFVGAPSSPAMRERTNAVRQSENLVIPAPLSCRVAGGPVNKLLLGEDADG